MTGAIAGGCDEGRELEHELESGCWELGRLQARRHASVRHRPLERSGSTPPDLADHVLGEVKTLGRDDKSLGGNKTRNWAAVVFSPHPMNGPKDVWSLPPQTGDRRSQLSASRPGSWAAAVVDVEGLGPVTAISLYGLLDERSDASVPSFDIRYHPDLGGQAVQPEPGSRGRPEHVGRRSRREPPPGSRPGRARSHHCRLRSDRPPSGQPRVTGSATWRPRRLHVRTGSRVRPHVDVPVGENSHDPPSGRLPLRFSSADGTHGKLRRHRVRRCIDERSRTDRGDVRLASLHGSEVRAAGSTR